MRSKANPTSNRSVEAKARKEAAYKARELALKARMARELEAMTCENVNQPELVSVGALPKDKQTVTLRFSALKVKVCKPFAR